MKPGWWIAVLLMTFAGCAEAPVEETLVTSETVDAGAYPVEGPVLASVTYLETPAPGAFGDDQESWGPRDITVDYLGKQAVLDRFGAPVEDHVFRADLTQTQVTSSGGSAEDFEYRYVQDDALYLFDAATGMFRGYAHDGLRVMEGSLFASNLVPHIGGEVFLGFTWELSDGTAGGFSQPDLDVQGGEIVEVERTMGFVPWTGDLPLPGACDPYALVDLASPDAGLDTIICRDAGVFPLWVWVGSDGEARVTYERTSPSFALPAFTGVPQADVGYEPVAPQEVPTSAGTVIRVPPTTGDDFSRHFVGAAAAIGSAPAYMLDLRDAQDAYIAGGWIGMGPLSSTQTPILPPATDWYDSHWLRPVVDGRSGAAFVSEGTDLGGETVYGVPEADRPFWSSFPEPVLPDTMVPDGAVRARWAQAFPSDPSVVALIGFSGLFGSDSGPEWFVFGECGVAQFSSGTGEMRFISVNGCGPVDSIEVSDGSDRLHVMLPQVPGSSPRIIA